MPQNLVTIKGTPNYLVIHLDTLYDFSEIKSALKKHIDHANGFFTGAKYKFQTTSVSLTDEQQYDLEQICSQHGLTHVADKTQVHEITSPQTKKALGLSDTELKQQNHFVTKNIRNGEDLLYKGNLILLGDINPGSKVAATGNIIVMGTIKGIVHAGVEGDLDSYIVASILDPMQIRIANFIARKPERMAVIKHHTPEIAQVEHDQIVISPYLTNILAKTS